MPWPWRLPTSHLWSSCFDHGPCAICGEQRATGRDLSPSASLLLCRYPSTNATLYIIRFSPTAHNHVIKQNTSLFLSRKYSKLQARFEYIKELCLQLLCILIQGVIQCHVCVLISMYTLWYFCWNIRPRHNLLCSLCRWCSYVKVLRCSYRCSLHSLL